MTVVAVFALAALCWWAGFQLRAALWAGPESRGLRALLASVAGLVLLHLVLSWLDLLGVVWSPAVVVPVLVGLALLLRWLLPSAQLGEPGQPALPHGWSQWLAGLPLLVFSVLAWQLETVAPEFILNWGIKGQRCFLAQGMDLEFLGGPWNVSPYDPTLLPELYGFTSQLSGVFHEPGLMLWSSLFFAGILIAARELLITSDKTDDRGQLLFAILAFTLAMVGIGQLLAGSADWPLCLALAGALPALVAEPSQARDLQVGFLAALAAGSKLEGAPLAAFLLLVYLVRARSPGPGRALPAMLMRTIAPVLFGVVPWVISMFRQGLFTSTGIGFEFSRVTLGLQALSEALLAPGWHQMALILLVLPFVVLHRVTRALGVLGALQVLFHLVVVVFLPVDTRQYLLASLPLLAFQLMPACLVGLGLILAPWQQHGLPSTGPARLQPGPDTYDSACRPHPFDEEFGELLRHRDFVVQWSLRNIKLRYKRSVLGVLWTLLEPLLIISVLALVFSALFRFELPNYPVYILSGWIMWDFFSRSTTAMANEMVNTRNLCARFHVPRTAYLTAAIISHLVNWVLSGIVLAGVMLVFDHQFSYALAWLPLAMLLTAVFTFGIGLIVATLTAFFHDFNLMFMVVLTVWLYATPIIYPLAIVPEILRPLLLLNPLTHILAVVRTPIYEGLVPSGAAWLTAGSLSLIAFASGAWLFTSSRRAFEYRV